MGKTRSQTSAVRRRVGLAVRMGLGFGLLAYVLYANADQFREVGRHGIDLRLVGLAFAMYLAGVLLAFTRWFGLVRALGLPFRLRDALRLGFIGLLFNLVIPGAVGGDVIMAAFLCREQGRKTQPIASVVVNRLIGLLGLFLLALLAGLQAWDRLEPDVRGLVVTAGIATGVTAVILGVAFLPLHRIGRKKRTSRLRVELAAAGQAYRTRPLTLLLALGMGMVTHTLNVFAFYTLSRALFPVVPSVASHLLIVPLVLFSTAIPLPFGALGAAEEISANLFRLAGHPGGAVAMIAFRLLQVGGAAIGAVVYLANHAAIDELRREAEARVEAADANGDPVEGITPGVPAPTVGG